MYCPNCGSQNADGATQCRTCNANLSLIPQALTGGLSEGRRGRRSRHEDQRPPNLGRGITMSFMGLGFFFVSLASYFFAPAGRIFWFWMLIPAFMMLGKGVAEIVTAWTANRELYSYHPGNAPLPPKRQTGELPPEPPRYSIPPPSVTEDTTRRLDPNKDRYPQGR